ncbi:MAG: NAD(P)H-binding protein [Bacteroidales bacterium]|nr:NAD(P)H-binding protein [Bacteroidales bacterium]
MKTAVVFGATGLTGRELINELSSNAGYTKVIVANRRNNSYSSPKVSQVIIPDFMDLQSAQDALKGDDYFCCIGTTIAKAGSSEAFRKVDFEIPVQIAKIAQVHGASCLVIISSVGANIASGNFYLRTKGEMEHAVRESFNGNLKILRPSLLMGNRNEFRFGERMAVFFMKVFGWCFIGPLKQYKGISARSVAKAMIHSTTLPPEKTFLESEELTEQ